MSEKSIKIQKVLDHHSGVLSCGAIIHRDGEVTDRTGDFTLFDEKGLTSAVLGPYGSPQGTFEMVAQYENDRKMLPQGMKQGGLFALIDKPGTDFVVVFFGHRGTDFKEYLKQREYIGQTLFEVFSE